MPLHSPSHPTRRQFLAETAASGLTATAGCLGDDTVDPDASLTATHGVTLQPDVDPARSEWYLSPDALTDYVDRRREQFGDAGPPSLAEPGAGEGEFVGAWASSPTVTGGDPDPLARLSLLCVTRRVDAAESRLRHVVWAGGVRETTRKPLVGDLGPTLALATVGVGLTTENEPVDLLSVTPRRVPDRTDDGTVTLRPDGVSPVTQPVPPGDLAVERESTDAGETYCFRWRGNRTAPTALTAVCETTDPGPDETVGFGVVGDLGVAGRGPL